MEIEDTGLRDAYTLERLTPLIGEMFNVNLGEYGLFPLKLVEVTQTGGEKPKSIAMSASPVILSVIWEGPKTPILNHLTFNVEHPSLGKHAVFLGPIKAIDEGILYQAVFN